MMVQRPLDLSRLEVMDDAIAEVLRKKTVTQRVEMIFAANRTMRLRLEGHFRTHHPEWDEARLKQEIARRMSRGSE
ncbi:MAG TPA: hypothetical protein VFC78_21700 [Tepidisphaeraceae bacterium]|nr:hypothetical protein [Tepidisphaeraceae bacterium]